MTNTDFLREAAKNIVAYADAVDNVPAPIPTPAPTPTPVPVPVPTPVPVANVPNDILVLKRPHGNLYHYGELFTYPAPNDLEPHGPYTGLDGTVCSKHYWGSRWYDGKFVVKNSIAELITARLIPPYLGITNLGPLLHAGGYDSDNLPTSIGACKPMDYVGLPLWMGQTGDNGGIGWQPEWHSALCVVGAVRLNNDVETIARDSLTLPIHVMDNKTGQPVDYRTYPHFSTYSSQLNSMIDPAQRTAITGDTPASVGLNYDTAHAAAFAFLAFCQTEDTVWLEEIQYAPSFQWSKDWPNNAMHLDNIQIREIAWGMRDLINAIVATRWAESKGLTRPEHLSSDYFMTTMLLPSLKWFSQFYNDPSPAGLAKINSVFGSPGTYAPWQYDFLTMCVGVGVWQGIPELLPLFNYLASGLTERLSGKQGWNTDYPTFYYVTRPQSTWKDTWAELVAEDKSYSVPTSPDKFLPTVLQNDYSDYVGQALATCRVGKMIRHPDLTLLYAAFESRVKSSGIPLNYRHAIGA